MSEQKTDSLEIRENTRLVPYDEWHPQEGPDLWTRLEVPSDVRNGSYVNEGAFNLKELPDGNGNSRQISHHERLSHWDRRLSSAFAVEHFLKFSRLGSPSPKILEIGTWPEKNPVIEAQHDNTLLGVLSANQSLKVVGVDNVDIDHFFPYKSYTPPFFGNGLFINGDFHDKKIQNKITKFLGGHPDLIVGNMVFENRLGNSYHKYPDRTRRAIWTPQRAFEEDKPEAADSISHSANDFLPSSGVIAVCNYGIGKLPVFVRTMPLLAVYLGQDGDSPYVQIRQKV